MSIKLLKWISRYNYKQYYRKAQQESISSIPGPASVWEIVRSGYTYWMMQIQNKIWRPASFPKQFLTYRWNQVEDKRSENITWNTV